MSMSKTTAVTQFHRNSITDGAAYTPGNHASLKHIKKVELKGITDEKLKALMMSYRDTIQGAEGNIEIITLDWTKDNLPDGEPFAGRILVVLAEVLRPALKQARTGVQVRVVRAVVMQYMDEISDFVVLHELWNGGKPNEFFHTSLAILCVPLALNVFFAVIMNAKKGKKAQVIGVLAALLHLTPAMHGAAMWKGEEQKETDVMHPGLLFMIGRITELLFEGLPELALSLLLAFRGQSSPKIIASLALSVASAAFVMMDVSVGFERGVMNGQKRGPHSSPVFGYLPLNPTLTKAQQAGLCAFFAGTVSLAAATVASAIATVSWAVVPAAMACEFAAFMGLMWRRGQLLFAAAQPDGSAVLISLIMHVAEYMMMCMAPWTELRDPAFVGGQLYFLLIMYRLGSFAVFFYVTTSMFSGTSGVEMGAGMAWVIFGSAAGAVLVGAATVFRLTPESHRTTWYSNGEFKTGPDYAQWWFEAGQLIEDANTVDQQRVKAFLLFSPTYHSREAVKPWLLGLKTDTPLLLESDKKLPKGCSESTGHSLASFFEKSTERANYMFHNDAASQQEISSHLASLARQIEEREPSPDPPAPSPPLLITAGPGEEEATVEELKRQLKEQAARHERAMREKDEEWGRRLREVEEECERRLGGGQAGGA
ncbi:hypothetical protein TeGR_g14601 [Tetraparma gracilis]|uniref:Uncharacterized protein n=1 Tax=Tetraparma gracilis TaxID=2962635 RepID=A0ABQ6MQ03_9STRA|nr:hypothetical protein TeGR_g14601 [Tetraparma gracilis]